MKCPNCQAQLDAVDTRFVECSYCGTRFANKEMNQVNADAGIGALMDNILQDKNNDGIPDIFQSGGDANISRTVVTSTVTVNGKTYNSMDEVPEEIRNMLGGLGVGDMSMPETQVFSSTNRHIKTLTVNGPPVFTEARYPSGKSGLFRAIIFFVIGLAVAGLLMYLMR